MRLQAQHRATRHLKALSFLISRTIYIRYNALRSSYGLLTKANKTRTEASERDVCQSHGNQVRIDVRPIHFFLPSCSCSECGIRIW
jgi:hypothetical protein